MRSRTIRPSFFSNEDLLMLPPLTRLFFVGLWCEADREGRLLDRPGRLKHLLLPADACSGEEMLAQLASAGFLVRYQVGGVHYLWIRNFRKQQGRSVHPHEQRSTIPGHSPDDCSTQEDTIGTPRRTNGTQCRALTSSTSSTSFQEGGKGENPLKEGEQTKEIPIPASVLQVPLPEPLRTEAFRARWLAYLRYRIDVGRPYTPSGAGRQLVRLVAWGEARAVAALVYTMAQEYVGVVEENGRQASKKSRAQQIKEDNEQWLLQQATTKPGSNTTASGSPSPPKTPPC